MLNINQRYFSNKRGKLILGSDLDFQFNNVVDYINDKLRPLIDSIEITVVGGAVGNASSTLCNVDDYNVEFKFIGDLQIDDNLISFKKLATTTPLAVLCTDDAGYLTLVRPAGDSLDKILFSESFYGNLILRQIESDDLDDNSITGNELGVLNKDNFAAGTFLNTIADGSLGAVNLPLIENKKIALNTINFSKIGVFDDLVYHNNIALQIELDDLSDGCIPTAKIANASILNTNFTTVNPFAAKNFKPEIITDAHLAPYVASFAGADFLTKGVITDDLGTNLMAGGKLTDVHIADDCLSIANFAPNVQVALRAAISKYAAIRAQTLNPPQQKKPQLIDAKTLTYAVPVMVPHAVGQVSLSVLVSKRAQGGSTWDYYCIGPYGGKWHYLFPHGPGSLVTYYRAHGDTQPLKVQVSFAALMKGFEQIGTGVTTWPPELFGWPSFTMIGPDGPE